MPDRLPLIAVRDGHSLVALERTRRSGAPARRAVCECGEALSWASTAGIAIRFWRGHAGAIR